MRAPKPAQAILFDLDGTLLDSKLSIRETLNTVVAERRLAPFSRADLDGLIGKPLREILATRTTDPATIEVLTQRYRAAYNETGWVTVDVFPGLVAMLRRLRSEGVGLACVTSKGQHETETLLFDLGLVDLFDAIVGDDDVRPLKPDPAPVREACRLLGVDPANAIMVGDTIFDVKAAIAAGSRCVGVLWGIHSETTLRSAGAAALATDARGLERVLDRMLAESIS